MTRAVPMILLPLAVAGCAAQAAPDRTAAIPNPIAVELFTSQGCSSCPPADRLAARLATEPGMVVISRPVTYWDRLGWKDTLARPENTALQQAYAARNLPGAGVFTPQVVIDGAAATIGSREGDIRKLVNAARTTAKPQLAIAQAPDGGKAIGVAGTSAKPAELMLVQLTHSAPVRIGSGENGGSAITYVNVVRRETKLGDWSGGTHAYKIPAPVLSAPGADRAAVLLREPGGGRILATMLL